MNLKNIYKINPNTQCDKYINLRKVVYLERLKNLFRYIYRQDKTRYLNPIPSSSMRASSESTRIRQDYVSVNAERNVHKISKQKSSDCALDRERVITFVYSHPRLHTLSRFGLDLFSALIVPAWSKDRKEK